MKQIPLIAVATLAGCASADVPPSPVEQFQYGATSHDPFWIASVGEDRIVLTMGPAGGRADGELTSYEFAHVVPKTIGAIRRWDSGEGTQVLSLEARPGPCVTGGRIYADKTRLYLSGRSMDGCGGQEIKNGNQN